MSEPDETMVEAAVEAALHPMDEVENAYFGITDAEPLDTEAAYPRLEKMARAVLSVPVVRDALARARMAEVCRTALGLACSDGWSDGESAMASYIETAETHLAVLSPADDSDIMPGSEFDGPVIL